MGPGTGRRLSRALGASSLALATPQLVAPRLVDRCIGVAPTRPAAAVMRAVGMQELGIGAAILLRPLDPALLWTRVGGDVVHLTMLARAASRHRNDRRRVAMAAAAVAGIAAADLTAARRLSRRNQTGDGALRVRSSITINLPPDDVYRRWCRFEDLPRFMAHLERVSVDGAVQHWVARAPAGTTVEWDAQVTEDVPGQRLAWRSLEGADVENSGSVQLRPAPRGAGTEMTVEIDYRPPGGSIGASVARLFGEEPTQQLKDDLRRFKQIAETGEVARSDAIPAGTSTQRQLHLLQRPAQPAADDGHGGDDR